MAQRQKSFGAAAGARRASLNVLNRVVGGRGYADILLENELELLDESQRPFTTELVYGVLRWQIRIDWIIDLFSSIKTKKLEHGVLNALRLGVYQLYFLSNIPAAVAVNETVKLIRPGDKKTGFVNAVLRRAQGEKARVAYPDAAKDPVRHISVVYSHPEWLVERWAARFGIDEAAELCRADLEIPPRTVRANALLMSRDELLERLRAEGIEARAADFSPEAIEIIKGRISPADPRFYIQDEASQLISYLVRPRPGESVLDACSAPGGKSTHIAELMRNTGSICALDLHKGRLKSVEEASRRLGVSIIKTIQADAGLPFLFPLPEGGLDAILCDAPCSGLGVLRRSPDIKLRRKKEDLSKLSAAQKKILGNIARYLKKGGRLVYSVCTFEPEETDEVVRWFLDSHEDFILEGAGGYVPEVCRGFVDESGLLRTYPHRHRMDGFFAARLKKRG